MIINYPFRNQYDIRCGLNRWRLFYQSDRASMLKSHWFVKWNFVMLLFVIIIIIIIIIIVIIITLFSVDFHITITI